MSNIKASKLIEAAASYVGYLEKATISNLDNFTANAGSNNYTCFARDYNKLMGTSLQGQPWCAMFVSYAFYKATGSLSAAKELLGGNLFSYCPDGVSYFKNKSRFYTSNPKIGDVIFYTNGTRAYHTGIVYKVDNSKVYTIEGNTSNTAGVVENGGCVAKKSYSLTYSKIMGYGRPEYNEETISDLMSDDWVKKLQASIGVTQDNIAGSQTLSKCPVIKNGSKGDTSRLLQEKLTALGYDTKGVDGIIGINSVTAIKAYQKANKLTVDGVFGQNSWKKILGLTH